MVLKVFLICVAVVMIDAAAKPSADYGWGFQNFDFEMPEFPSFPDLPPFPSYTRLPPLNPLHFQPMDIHVPSPLEIVNRQSDPGVDFIGAVIKSARDNRMERAGQSSGGIVFVSNNNGNVHRVVSGQDPTNIEDELVFPSMPEFNFKPFVFTPIKPIVFTPIEPIDPTKITNYVPKDGEHYMGSYYSSSVKSENINGVSKTEGDGEKIVNLGGHVTRQKIKFGDNSGEQFESYSY